MLHYNGYFLQEYNSRKYINYILNFQKWEVYETFKQNPQKIKMPDTQYSCQNSPCQWLQEDMERYAEEIRIFLRGTLKTTDALKILNHSNQQS